MGCMVKRALFGLHIFLPAALVTGLLSCDSTTPGPATRQESDKVMALCAPRATELQQRLRSTLMGALESGGPAGAFAACTRLAPRLLQDAGQEDPRLDMKRVARRPLEAANAPDVWERLALEHFEGAVAAGRVLPTQWVQRLEQDGQRRYRAYLPIPAGGPCLACHGGAEAMPDTVRALLASRGSAPPAYAEGDLLGLLRVEIAARELP